MHSFSTRCERRVFLCIILLLTLPPVLTAHPHMFISAQTEFVWEGQKLQGAYETWTFDRFFSADIIQGYDSDKNGVFNTAEIQDIYDNAFINTQHYYYFTFIRQGDKRSSPKTVSRFSAWQKDGILSYRFYIDLSSYNETDLYFAVYDYTFFCDFRYDEKTPVLFTGTPTAFTPQYTIRENKKYPVYYDPLDAADMTAIYDTWKPGLQIYYPKEIHLYH